MGRRGQAARARRRGGGRDAPSAGGGQTVVSLADAAEAMGTSPGALAELLRGAGVELEGDPADWSLEAHEVEAVAGERERAAMVNAKELERLSALFEDGA